MKKSLYLFSSGKLFRRENTLWFENLEGDRRVIPIESISEIEVFGELDVNKRVLEFLSLNKIPIHFYNHYGYYVGSFYPREHLNSGYLLRKQVEHYLEPSKRIFLARSFIEGALANILRNLKRSGRELGGFIREIEKIQGLINSSQNLDVEYLMALEGNARVYYYGAFSEIIKDFPFEKRTKRPPKDEINALISFGNSLLYTQVLSEIYQTHLDPRIGYLHQSNTRSFTLNLDIAEIFKPLIVDRVALYLTNRGILKASDFRKEAGLCYLSESGKRKFVKAFEEKLSSTVKHRKLRRKVSHKRFIRLECYKLIKHLIGDEIYQPLKAWW